jgi:hypothetical protein
VRNSVIALNATHEPDRILQGCWFNLNSGSQAQRERWSPNEPALTRFDVQFAGTRVTLDRLP